MIDIQNLFCGYRNNEVLRDVSLKIPEKGLSVLLGPNGAGKSTLLFAIMGYLKASSGSIVIKDKDLRDYSRAELAKIIAFIPANMPSMAASTS